MPVFARRFLPHCLLALLLFCSCFLAPHLSHAQTATAAPSAATPAAALPTATPASDIPHAVATQKTAVILDRSGTLAQKAQSLFGLLAFTGICFGIGQLRNRAAKPQLRTVLWGLGLQFLFAVLVLNTPGFFQAINAIIGGLLNFSREGAGFLFGKLIDPNVPVGIPDASGNITPTASFANTGATFAFTVLTTIIFFSALSTLMYFMGILQPIVRALSWVMQRTMGTSGAETLSAVANIFLGQTEAPLFVRPFIAGATKSELMAIMCGGFSNIASGVLAAYVAMLVGYEPQIAGHLLSASIISAPAGLVVAKLLVPETEVSETMGTTKLHIEKNDANVIDAAARGAVEGLQLALNVGAVLLVFIALVAMVNALLGFIGGFIGMPTLSMQLMLGWVLAPVAWLLGVPWADCDKVGSLIGVKTVINEFVAYLQLAGDMGKTPGFLSPRSFLLAVYALCGFANFSSIAIQIGGIGGMAPERRGDLSRLGMISMFGGAVASCMTACVIGVLL